MTGSRNPLPHLPAVLKHFATALAGIGLAVPALAADDAPRFEITPFAAYRVGGTFEDADGQGSLELRESSAWGLVVNGAVESNTEWEVLYARQSTDVDASAFAGTETLFDMDIDYLHFGGTYLLDGERVRPFVALTIGATRFDPRLPGFDARTYASASLGAGWKFRLAKHVGLRLEARGFGTLIESNSRLFCASDGGVVCLIVAEGRILAQWEARAGFTARF